MKDYLGKTFKNSGLLALRLLIAAIFLYHGYPKVANMGPTMDQFAQMGFPGFLGPVVGIVEVVAGLSLLIGAVARYAALALSVIITVAIVSVQGPGAAAEGVLLTSGLERDLLLLAGLVVLMGHGPGIFSVD